MGLRNGITKRMPIRSLKDHKRITYYWIKGLSQIREIHFVLSAIFSSD